MSTSKYKSISGFDPRSIPGCQLWFDAAEIASFTFASHSTTQVTQWRDKSANSFNMASVGSSYPVLSYTGFNGKPCLTFDGSTQDMNGPSAGVNFSTFFPSSGGNTTFMVFSQTGGVCGGMWFQWSGNGSGNSHGVQAYGGNNLCMSIPYTNNVITNGLGQNLLVTLVSRIASNYSESCDQYCYGNITGNPAIYTNQTDSGFTWNFTEKFVIGAKDQNHNYRASGYHAEYLVYNRELTSIERQEIEGYLAWKWGLNSYIPTSNPHYSVRPLSRMFNPVDIPVCALWLDGADASTLSLSGTGVMSWTDKSKQLTFNVLNSGYYPTFSASSGLFFNNPQPYITGSTQGLFTHTQWTLPDQNFTVFCASYPYAETVASNNSYRNACFFGTGSYTSPPNVIFSIENGASGYSTDLILLDYNGSNWGQAINCSTNTTSTPRVDVLVSKKGATSGWNFINGVENSYTGYNTYSGSQTNYPINVSYIGAYTSTVQGSRNFNGYIYEIIVYETALSSSDRQIVEGYLANKWNFPSSLNSDHPFKSLPPSSSLPFSPIIFSNCILWLDPTNNSSLTLSGSNVISINDLSSSGSNATRYNGSAYATIATVSGSRLLSFPGSNIVYRSAMALSGSAYTIFVVMGLVSTSGNGSGYQRAVNADSGNGTIFIGALSGNLATFCGNNGFNDVSANSPTYALTGNGLQVVTMYVSGSSLIPYVNGTAMTAKTGTTGATTVLDIGCYQDSTTQAWNGYIGDIIVYSRALTTSERQKVEGYLAWKWKLNQYLPNTSPYYKFQPAEKEPIALSGGASTTVNFSYTGSDQTWTAPTGVTSITVTLNGAGGGNGYGSSGGAGGLVSGTLAVTAGYTYTIVVGKGGGSGYSNTYGGGGKSGVYGYGSQGGGRSAISYGGTDLVTAGAGGGSGYYNNGGAGGGNNGGSGNGSGGGGQYGGGYPSTSYGYFYYDGTYGGQYYGGDGGYYYGSGGGSGWYGGGGGGYYYQAGAGGSSYVGNLTGTVVNTQGGGAGSATNGSVTIVY